MSINAKYGYALAGFIGGNLILVACVAFAYMLIGQEDRHLPEISLEAAIEAIQSKRAESVTVSGDRVIISVAGEDRRLHLETDASRDLLLSTVADARILFRENPTPSFGWTLVSMGWMVVPLVLVLLTLSIILLAFSIYYSSRNASLPR